MNDRSPMVSLAHMNVCIKNMQPKIDELITEADVSTLRLMIENILQTPLMYESMYNEAQLKESNAQLVEGDKRLLEDYNNLKKLLFICSRNSIIDPTKLLATFKTVALSIDKLISDERIDYANIDFATDYNSVFLEHKGTYATAYLLWFYYEVLDRYPFRIQSDAEIENSIGETFAVRKSDHHEALKHFKRAVQLNPNLATGWLNAGNSLTEIGEYQKAINHYEKAIDTSKTPFIPALYKKAVILNRLGDLNEALKCCNEILKLSPFHEDTIELKMEIESFIGN